MPSALALAILARRRVDLPAWRRGSARRLPRHLRRRNGRRAWSWAATHPRPTPIPRALPRIRGRLHGSLRGRVRGRLPGGAKRLRPSSRHARRRWRALRRARCRISVAVNDEASPDRRFPLRQRRLRWRRGEQGRATQRLQNLSRRIVVRVPSRRIERRCGFARCKRCRVLASVLVGGGRGCEPCERVLHGRVCAKTELSIDQLVVHTFDVHRRLGWHAEVECPHLADLSSGIRVHVTVETRDADAVEDSAAQTSVLLPLD